jgi:hypothetical protein
MLKKTVTAIGIAALAGAGAMSILPSAAVKADTTQGIVELAQCKPANPCAAKGNPCNPCAAKKKAANPCNPCAAKKKAANPCNPCAAKKK